MTKQPYLRLAAIAGLLTFAAAAGAFPTTPSRDPIGRWDLTVKDGDSTYASWLEVKLSGSRTLVGSFVGRGGSARPVSRVEYDAGKIHFTVPPQWESGPRDFVIDGTLANDKLSGTITDDNGRSATWTGVRAPLLHTTKEPKWGEPINLIGSGLSRWHARNANRPNGWVMEGGMLRNVKPGNDLVTNDRWMDVKVHAEFRYPEHSNSGIYLRGRYEAQIEDNYGMVPEAHLIGGIYGFLTPRVNAAKRAGEWQTYDLTLVGRYVSIALNGEPVIERQEIPGITGGALDSNEGEPGPLMVQGDHGPVDFRKLTLTPARN